MHQCRFLTSGTYSEERSVNGSGMRSRVRGFVLLCMKREIMQKRKITNSILNKWVICKLAHSYNVINSASYTGFNSIYSRHVCCVNHFFKSKFGVFSNDYSAFLSILKCIWKTRFHVFAISADLLVALVRLAPQSFFFLSPNRIPRHPRKSSPHCRVVPVANLTRGHGGRKIKKERGGPNQRHLLHLRTWKFIRVPRLTKMESAAL